MPHKKAPNRSKSGPTKSTRSKPRSKVAKQPASKKNAKATIKESTKTKPATNGKRRKGADEPDHDPELAFKADLMVRTFRAKDMEVYPGKIVVIRAGSSVMHPIDDADFDQTNERIMGVSLWGPFDEFQTGLASIDPVNNSRFVAYVSGEDYRPPLGVPLIDTWIARAETIRFGKSTGTIRALGAELPIPSTLQIAAMREIERVLRESTIRLLDAAPADQRHALLALATIHDLERPTPEILTAAIRELTASVPAWKRLKNPTPHSSAAAAPITRPTSHELIDVIGFSRYTFRRIRLAAGIKSTLRGHDARNRRFAVDEVDRMLAVVRDGNYLDREVILREWAKWGSNSVATRVHASNSAP